MTCDTITKQLPLLFYGELSFDDEELIHQHLESCAACKSEFGKLRAIQRAVSAVELEPPPNLLQNCRRELRRQTTACEDIRALEGRPTGWLDRFRAGWTSAFVWKPAAAAALLAIGFFGGQISPRELGGAANKPGFSRVRFVQPGQDGKVRLVVEDVRERTLSGTTEDPAIRSLLVAAAREANDPGVRVETVDLLKSQSDSAEVRRALLSALQSDVNPGVRLKALEALRPSAQDNETRRVLAQVLLSDDNPGVRTQAIDLLTERREPAMVGVLQELVSREDNNYVRLKCQRVLHEMNASAETF